MTSEEAQWLQVDAVPGDYPHLSLECHRCSYFAEMDAPVDLDELIRRADEHKEVCPDG